jgi:hypothetical protein
MGETKLDPKHPGNMAERITKAMRNSGEGAGNPGHQVVTKGTGPTRTHTNLHHTAGHHGAGPAGGEVKLQNNDRSGGER